MARRLLSAGHDLVVWNRTREKAEALIGDGAAIAPTPAEAASGAEAVITMVADPQALREVTQGSEGIAAGLGDASFIEMSTVGPATIEWLSGALPDGTELIDAPVLGSLTEAEAGELRVFVGGPGVMFERWRPVFEALGTPMHIGPLGSGAAAKLVANLTLFGVLGVLGEGVALADGLGVERGVAFEVLSGTPVGAQAQRRRPVIETGDAPTRFSLSLARKDAALIIDAARRAGIDLRLTPAALSWLEDANAAGMGERDYSAVLRRIIGAE